VAKRLVGDEYAGWPAGEAVAQERARTRHPGLNGHGGYETDQGGDPAAAPPLSPLRTAAAGGRQPSAEAVPGSPSIMEPLTRPTPGSPTPPGRQSRRKPWFAGGGEDGGGRGEKWAASAHGWSLRPTPEARAAARARLVENACKRARASAVLAQAEAARARTGQETGSHQESGSRQGEGGGEASGDPDRAVVGFATQEVNEVGVYTGQVNGRSRPQGLGTASALESHLYEGAWDDGLPQGHGVYTFANGNVYAGGVCGGRLQGTGSLTLKNGVVFYEGEWHGNNIHGHGRQRGADGAVVHEGTFRDNAPLR